MQEVSAGAASITASAASQHYGAATNGVAANQRTTPAPYEGWLFRDISLSVSLGLRDFFSEWGFH